MKLKELFSDSYLTFLKEHQLIDSEDDEADLGSLWEDVKTLYLQLSYLDDREYEMMLCYGILEILDNYDF